ncbi:SUMF1/EgtB/PvdO family nonheme iron enzyme, partial [Levilinea saccharolytica]
RERGPLPWEEALTVLQDVGAALCFAHQRGIIHRDVKPSNILLSREPGEGAVLSDFGLVKAVSASAVATSSHTTIGTPQYIPPEVWHGKVPTPAVDQYALACVLVELLTGSALFDGPTPPAVMAAHFQPPRLPQAWPAEVPEAFTQWITKALAPEPEQRFSGIEEFIRALTQAPVVDPAQQQAKPVDPKTEEYHLQAARSQVEYERQQAAEQARRAEEERLARQRQAAARQRQQTWFHRNARWLAVGMVGTIALVPLLVTLINWGGSPPLGTQTAPVYQAVSPTLTFTLTPTSKIASTLDNTTTFGIGATFVSFKDLMMMVYVPAGKFQMGSNDGDLDERPVHTVELGAFWIDQTEVNNAQYARCVTEGACQPPVRASSYARQNYYGNAEFDKYPVIYVNWAQASAYCAWAGRRLPTEAEWEKAARGTDERIYPWGNQAPNSQLLNYFQNVGDTTAVGSFPSGASPYGALDMAGNVWEWVSDPYGDYPLALETNTTGATDEIGRVLRGGSWNNYVNSVRAAYRYRSSADYTDSTGGFRCAQSADRP